VGQSQTNKRLAGAAPLGPSRENNTARARTHHAQQSPQLDSAMALFRLVEEFSTSARGLRRGKPCVMDLSIMGEEAKWRRGPDARVSVRRKDAKPKGRWSSARRCEALMVSSSPPTTAAAPVSGVFSGSVLWSSSLLDRQTLSTSPLPLRAASSQVQLFMRKSGANSLGCCVVRHTRVPPR
jgi:hypothetical protein